MTMPWKYPRLLCQALAAIETLQRVCRESQETTKSVLETNQSLLETVKFWEERYQALEAEDRPWRTLITEIEKLPPVNDWKN